VKWDISIGVVVRNHGSVRPKVFEQPEVILGFKPVDKLVRHNCGKQMLNWLKY
jgi:hypothetical protein